MDSYRICRMTKVAAVFLFFSHCAFCIDFLPHSSSSFDSGGTVTLVCDIGVASFTASVTLLKDGSQKTVCDNTNICTPPNSDSNRYQYTSNASAVTVEISNLAQASDEGSWTCNVGTSLSSSYNLTVSTPANPDNGGDKCPLFQYAFWPCFCIVLVGTLLVIAVSYHVGKDSKLQEGSLKKSCGCCPSDNTCCMLVCPLCTNLLCTDSKKIAKNVISVVVFLCVAAVIGVIIAFGLGVDSGKCILALILSIVCGLALMAIFTVSVYPHWPCLPEKGENGGNCFRTCRISTVEEPNRPAGNQASPNRNTSRSPQASASEVHFTTEGRSPRPLPAIGSEAKQLPPISFEQSTLKNKQVGAPLPEIPKSNKLPPVDTVNNEEDRPKRRKKKKKKREGEENEEEDKRDSQNSGGQANVEEED